MGSARRLRALAARGALATALLLPLPALAQVVYSGDSRGLFTANPQLTTPLRPAPGEGEGRGIFRGIPREGGNGLFGRRDFAHAVPEPGAAALFALGLAALVARQRRR